MVIKMLCSTANLLSLENDFEFLHFKFSSKLKFFEEEMISEGLTKIIGSTSTDSFKNSPYFSLTTHYASSKSNLTEDDVKLLNDNNQIYYDLIEKFLFFLWLVKDNCCRIDDFHLHAVEGKKLISRNNSNIYSTHNGDVQTAVFFSNNELNEGLYLFMEGYQLFYHKNLKVRLPKDEVSEAIIARVLIPYDYKKVNRVERAFHFLKLARTTAQLPLKISFHVCIYEALFYGTNTGEISHQIAERVALYVNGSRPSMKNLYKFMKDVYGIRSTYFHGNSFKNNKLDLIQISRDLDSLTRTILKRIILNDSLIFLQEDNDLNQSFLDLIFEDQREPHSLVFESDVKHLRFNRNLQ